MSCKVIAIEKKKVDVGKSTTALNLGVGLKMKGEEALLIEGNPQGCVPACTSAEGGSTDRAGGRDSIFSATCGRVNDFIAFSRDEIFLITENCCITPLMRSNACV